jgi:hypothetical protein
MGRALAQGKRALKAQVIGAVEIASLIWVC